MARRLIQAGEQNSGKKASTKLLYLFVLLMIIVPLLYYIFWPSRGKNVDEQLVIKKQINETAKKVREELTYLSLQEKGISEPVFKDDLPKGQKLQAQFILTINAAYVKDVFFFKTEEYIFETGGDPKYMYQICDELDKVINGKSKILDAIRNNKIKLVLKNVEIELQVVLVELLYTLRKFIVVNTEVEILIKGYADGQRNPWRRRLEEGYEFQKIKVYPPLDSLSKNPFEYIRDENYVYQLGDFPFYVNKDLPNLRAKVFKKDFIDPFIKYNCGMKKEVKVGILDGYEFKNEMGKEEERKVQVIILLY